MGISPWGAGAVIIVAAAAISWALQPDDTPPPPGQTSGPCTKEAKSGTIGTMAVESTAWTLPLAVAFDGANYWANPAGTTGAPTDIYRVCLKHDPDGYSAWMSPGDAKGTRGDKWIKLSMHPEGQK